jgi:hypothetical protein
MFVVSESNADAIRALFDQEGELSAAIELRRRFQGSPTTRRFPGDFQIGVIDCRCYALDANLASLQWRSWRVGINQHSRRTTLVHDNSLSFCLQLLVHDLMHFDDVAGGIIEEDLIPAVHRPLATVGIGNVLFLEPLFESFNVIGAESDHPSPPAPD